VAVNGAKINLVVFRLETAQTERYANLMFRAQSRGSVVPNECYLVVHVTRHPFSLRVTAKV
jgi:hypothetical protein